MGLVKDARLLVRSVSVRLSPLARQAGLRYGRIGPSDAAMGLRWPDRNFHIRADRKPAIHSLVSAKGLSVITRWPWRTRTVTALSTLTRRCPTRGIPFRS